MKNMPGRPGGSPSPFREGSRARHGGSGQEMQGKLTVHGNSTDDILTQVLLNKDNQVS
jgi:hypothetical protein